jgi:hypothetical protein
MSSREYDRSVAEHTEHHERSKTFSGSLLVPHIPAVLALADAEECASGLDYGCGKGVQYAEGIFESQLGFVMAKYDPAVQEFADEGLVAAGQHYDLVILSHVLFWIPSADLTNWVLPRIYQLARKAVFVVETVGDPKKKFLTNEAAHPRGLHAIDWIDLLLPHTRDGIVTQLVTEYRAADRTIYAGVWRL